MKQEINSMKNIAVHIRYAVLIIFGISLIFLASNIANSQKSPTWIDIFKILGWTSFYCIPFYAANAFIYSVIHKKFPFNSWQHFLKRLILGILISGLISVLLGGILFVIEGIISGDGFTETVNWVFSVESLDEIQRLIWISSTVAIVMYVFNFIRNYQEEKLNIQKQKTVKISTEHESLKSQIGPHFLFNSLNVLNGLISENTDKAQEFVSELSSVYRYVLEQKDKVLVSLREEIDFSKTYMNLIQKRFEDGLTFEIQEEVPEDFQIVPLSLQILLENCIKHNRISTDEPLKVKVYIKNNKLIIHNNLQIKNQINQSIGKGLQNIINRYKTFTQQEVEIIKTDHEFIVKLPLLTEKIITMEIEKKYTKEEYKLAKKRVEEIQGFYWNLASYVIVNLFFTFLDLKDDGQYSWAFWPLVGWGIGVVFHGLETFGFNSYSWKDRMIRKELERRQREHEEFNSKF